MPELVAPDPRYRLSFMAAVEEFLSAGDERFTRLSVLPPVGDFEGESVAAEALTDPDQFTAFTARLRQIADRHVPLPDGIVAATQLWWVDGD